MPPWLRGLMYCTVTTNPHMYMVCDLSPLRHVKRVPVTCVSTKYVSVCFSRVHLPWIPPELVTIKIQMAEKLRINAILFISISCAESIVDRKEAA